MGAQQCVRELQRQAPQGEAAAGCNELVVHASYSVDCLLPWRCSQPMPCRHVNSAAVLSGDSRGAPPLCPPSVHRPWLAATIVVLALLPMEPMMLHAPQRMFGPMVQAANAEMQQYVAAQGSEWLKFKGGLSLGGWAELEGGLSWGWAGCCTTAADALLRPACRACSSQQPAPRPSLAKLLPSIPLLCLCLLLRRLRRPFQAARRRRGL